MSPSARLGRTAAAALSTSVVGGGGGYLYYKYLTKDSTAEDESSEERSSKLHFQPTSWTALSSPARDLLCLPMHTTRCDEAVDPSYPDLSRFGKGSYLKRYLTPEIFKQLQNKKTACGVTLEDLIRSGVSLPWGARPIRGCGIYAGDAESYQVFAPLLVPILEDYHHFRQVPHPNKSNVSQARGRPNPLLRRQVTNLNPGYVLQQKLDPEGQYILHTRMRVARSIQGFAFSPVISRKDRRELERLFQDCVQDWNTTNDKEEEEKKEKDSNNNNMGGKYMRVMDMTNEQHDDLIQRHIHFHDQDEYSLSAGLGRDWPDSRGIFLDDVEDPELMIWLNAEDHLRVITMSKGGDLLGVFTRLSKALTALEASLQKRGHGFCMDPHLGFLNTSPENLGTALRASVFVKLPRLGQQPGFDDLLDRLRLEKSSRFKESRYTGIFDIANAERLGQSAVRLMNTMINGVGRLIALEKKLEQDGM
jgi:creatine kinase